MANEALKNAVHAAGFAMAAPEDADFLPARRAGEALPREVIKFDRPEGEAGEARGALGRSIRSFLMAGWAGRLQSS
ncbi:MAG: hypothetical protein R3D33_03215 [Hyphomicrobiaceae bacterium]